MGLTGLVLVLTLDDQALEHLPPERRQLCDLCRHVLVPVVDVDDGVELEHDAVPPAPSSNAEHLRHVAAVTLAVLPAPDQLVCLLDERVAGYGQDIQVSAVLAEPPLADLAPVADDAHALEVQVVFAVPQELAKELWVQEGLAAGDVELAHAGI